MLFGSAWFASFDHAFQRSGWPIFVLVSLPALGLALDWSGLLEERPVESVALLTATALALLAAELVLFGGSRSLAYPLILAALTVLAFSLSMILVFKNGHPIVLNFAAGLFLIYMITILMYKDSTVATGALLGTWAVLMAGGITALNRAKERGALYGASYFLASVGMAILAAVLPVMTMGFSSSIAW